MEVSGRTLWEPINAGGKKKKRKAERVVNLKVNRGPSDISITGLWRGKKGKKRGEKMEILRETHAASLISTFAVEP